MSAGRHRRARREARRFRRGIAWRGLFAAALRVLYSRPESEPQGGGFARW